MYCSLSNMHEKSPNQTLTGRRAFRNELLFPRLKFSLQQIMNRDYKEVPWYWYLGLLLLAFFSGKKMPHLTTSSILTRNLSRSDRGSQRPDYITVVVLYHCFVTGRRVGTRSCHIIEFCRICADSGYVASIHHTLFNSALRKDGQRHCYKPADEDGCRSDQSRETCRKPLCTARVQLS